MLSPFTALGRAGAVGLLSLLAAAPLAAQARVTVIHGIPGLPAPVEVFANNNRLFAFDFGDQEELDLAAGQYALEVRLNGSPVLSATATVNAGDDVTVIAHLDASGGNTLSIFAQDQSALALPQSRLQVRHTAAAPAVDVVLEQNGARVGVLSNLSNGNEAAVDVAPGTYDVSLFLAGTTTRALGPATVALEDGIGYSVHAVGQPNQASFGLLTQRNVLTARVSVVHGIPGLPAPVEVFANGNRLFAFDFTDIQGPLVLNPGTYNLEVRLNGNPVLSAPNAAVGAGDDVSVVAHLDANGANTLSLFPNDVSALAAENTTRVTVRHLAAAPAVDIGVDRLGSRLATISNVVNGQEAIAVLPSVPVELGIFAAGTSNQVFGPATYKPIESFNQVFYAIGDLNGGSFSVVRQDIDLLPAVPGELVATTSGVACGGSIGATPSRFAFGETFSVDYTGGQPNAMGMINVGGSASTFNGLSLPLDLARFGAPGCFLLTDLVATHPVPLDGQGNASFTLTVPRSEFGSFSVGYVQFFSASNANALGLVASDLLTVQ